MRKEILCLAIVLASCGQKTKRETVIIQGEKGDSGEQGVAGEKGDKGDKGDAGMSGRDGVGMQGETGMSGRDGVDGRQGPMGPAGRDGRDGVDGHDGEDGHNGETIIVPQPKYSKYCYGYRDVYLTKPDCADLISQRYHIYYQVYTMPNGDVFGRMCEGYDATLNNCEKGLLTTQTWTIGHASYSTAPLQSRYLSARLTATDKAEFKGKDFTLNVSCQNQP
jgi:hypothetical protein